MQTLQYTIRGVTPRLDSALRKRARLSGRSFNKTVVEALEKEVFGAANVKGDDFEWLFGSGKDLLDDGFYQAIADQKKIDPEMWQ
jgi:hypothetical protein